MRNKTKNQFCILGCVLLAVYFTGVIITRGKLLYPSLHGDKTDMFMDFINSMGETVLRDPYENGVMYPPFCYVIFYIFLRIMPESEAVSAYVDNSISASKLKLLQEPMVSVMLFLFISLIGILFLIYRFQEEEKGFGKILPLLLCVSVPFLFAFERANIILFSFIFAGLFFCYKDSDNKVLRELSFICLAISAAIKIYPAVFGLILFKEKRYKEAVRLIFYGIIFFAVPFVFFKGGFSNFFVLIKNIINTSEQFSTAKQAYKLNFQAVFKELFTCMGVSVLYARTLASVCTVILTTGSLVAFLFLDKEWECVCILCALLIGLPGISFVYTAVFMTIPLMMYFRSCEKCGKKECIYILLFLLVFFPLPLGWSDIKDQSLYYYYNNTYNSIQIGTGIIILLLLQIGKGMYRQIQWLANKKYRFVFWIEPVLLLLLFILLSGIMKNNVSAQIEKECLEVKAAYMDSAGISADDARIYQKMGNNLYVDGVCANQAEWSALKYTDCSYLIIDSDIFMEDIEQENGIVNALLSGNYVCILNDNQYLILEYQDISEIYLSQNIIWFYGNGFFINTLTTARHWAKNEAYIYLFNPYSESVEGNIEFDIQVYLESEDCCHLEVSADDREELYLLEKENNSISQEIVLEPGMNTVYLSTDSKVYGSTTNMQGAHFSLKNCSFQNCAAVWK